MGRRFFFLLAATVVVAASVLFVPPVAVRAKADAAPSAAAHGAEQPVDGWLPWETAVGTMESGLSSEEFDAVLKNRTAVEAVLRRVGALTRGAEVLPSWEIGRRGDLDDPRPDRYGMNLMIFRPSRAVARTSGLHISIRINAPFAAGARLFSDAEGPIYRELPVVGEVAGFPRHQLSGESAAAQDTGWVISSGDRAVWLPVSRERWIRALIGDARGKLDEFEKKAREGARERRERFERMYEGMKKISEENAEEMRERFEMRESGFARIADSLAAGDADALEQLGRRAMALYLRAIPRLEEELATMPAEERTSPAYCCESTPQGYFAPPSYATRPSLLVEPSDARARPLIAPNPEFFRRDLPPTAMQSIAVTQRVVGRSASREAYMDAVREEVDWLALKALLR